MHRLKKIWGETSEYRKGAARCVTAALTMALVLTGCGLQSWERDFGELWDQAVETSGPETSDFEGSALGTAAPEVRDDYSTDAPEAAQGSRLLTWQSLLESQDDEPKMDYTDPLAWEYCYQYLDEPGRQWYRDIQRILATMGQEQELSAASLEAGLTEEDIDRIFCYVLADHPEYFYVDGYRYTKYSRMDKLVKITFSGSYTYDSQECASRWEQIQEAAEAFLAQVPGGEDDYERVRYVYETLIRNTDYVLDAPDSQNLYSVLVSGASVCQGYAKATQYLLNHLGIPCVLVQGQVEPGEGHAWNLLCLDGEYYYMDTTWGDASYRQVESASQEEDWLPQVNYDYLCVTTQQLLRTHEPSPTVPLPECTATRDNYYVREGCLLSACEEETLRQAFDRAISAGRQEISLKCEEETVYRQLLEHLIEQKEVFSYLEPDCSTLHYARNEKQLSITFWFS